jgi:hypothetical protein
MVFGLWFLVLGEGGLAADVFYQQPITNNQ